MMQAQSVTRSFDPMGPCWTPVMTDKDRSDASGPHVPTVGRPAPGRGVCWWESWQRLARDRRHLCLPFFDTVFKFLMYHFDVWQSTGEKKKKTKSKSTMPWQLAAFSPLQDFVDLPEESWLLIRAALWTPRNQIKCNLAYVSSCLRQWSKVISLLQLTRNCLEGGANHRPPRRFEMYPQSRLLNTTLASMNTFKHMRRPVKLGLSAAALPN